MGGVEHLNLVFPGEDWKGGWGGRELGHIYPGQKYSLTFGCPIFEMPGTCLVLGLNVTPLLSAVACL